MTSNNFILYRGLIIETVRLSPVTEDTLLVGLYYFGRSSSSQTMVSGTFKAPFDVVLLWRKWCGELKGRIYHSTMDDECERNFNFLLAASSTTPFGTECNKPFDYGSTLNFFAIILKMKEWDSVVFTCFSCMRYTSIRQSGAIASKVSRRSSISQVAVFREASFISCKLNFLLSIWFSSFYSFQGCILLWSGGCNVKTSLNLD